jgi:gamma-butyrobetaine dioxygenase
LYIQSSSAFEILAHTPLTYHYINDGHHLHHAHPIISLSPFPSPDQTENALPSIDYINYSPPFQAPLPIDTPKEFYGALTQFADLLEEDRYEYTLKEGEAVLFDNRRVLHARTEFREVGNTPEGETSRWLKGCYLEADDVLDLGRTLRERAEMGS